jgi:hypothetical protein
MLGIEGGIGVTEVVLISLNLGRMAGKFTDDTICQGSRNTIEIKIQRTYVESNDTMRVKKIWFVNSFPNVNTPSSASASTDLTVINTEAKRRYLQTVRITG